MSTHVVLIACSSSKLDRAAPARELYTGQLFKLALTWAEEQNAQPFVLSAKHGLVKLDEELEPYDFTMGQHFNNQARETWGDHVISDLARALQGAAPGRITVFAGVAYKKWIWGLLRHRAADFHTPRWPEAEYPLEGIGIGEQKRVLAQMIEEQRQRAGVTGLPHPLA